ncbi:putative poly(A) polymerase large subunit [Yalta virus]|nr:putative poly(A) polymerase large subunit [Yalta virus]
MNSKQILLRVPQVKEEAQKDNGKNYKLFERYVGPQNYKKLVLNDQINFLEKNNARTGFVISKINDKEYKSFIYGKLNLVYEELIKPFIPPELDFLRENALNIKINLDKFFNLQREFDTILNVSSVLNFHTTFLNFFGVYFIPLVDRENLYIHQEIYSISSNIYTENENVLEFAKKYINKYDIEFVQRHRMKHNTIENHDTYILELLQNIFNNLIKKLQKKKVSTNNKACRFLTYGSYTTYEINHEITYNDIDIYMSNPLSLLVTFLVTIKLTLNIDVDIFKIPFVIGHVSLRYKGTHFTDCLYMDEKTISEVPTVVIKEITFVHPIIQVINLFRMMSELRRMSSLSETNENRINTEKKLATLLQYSCEAYDIDIDKDLTKINIDVETVNQSFVIDIGKVFKNVKGYDNIKDYLDFDYLVILRYAPKLFLEYLKDKNPIIRKQWFAIFNEIVAEFHNKKLVQSKINKTKNKNKKKLNRIIVHEEDIIFERPIKLSDFSDLDSFIKNNNVLLMSNFTTECYMKVTTNNINLIKNYEMTNITKETVLSSFVLTQILTNFDNEELVRFYFLFLLSFIKRNNEGKEKTNELSMLGQPKSNTNPNTYISTLGKNKLEGKHETFGLVPQPRLKNLFFYKKQEETVYKNYQHFLDVTTYN